MIVIKVEVDLSSDEDEKEVGGWLRDLVEGIMGGTSWESLVHDVEITKEVT